MKCDISCNRRSPFTRSRKGSYIAEAAVVLPIIIITVITVVLIVMFFYEESVNTSKMHIALRCEAGQITEKTTSYINENGKTDAGTVWDGNLTVTRKGFFKNVNGSKKIFMIAKGVLSSHKTGTVSDSAHAVNGPAFVRIWGNFNE